MSIDSIAFPLPVLVKGYACLTKSEMELANKDIDPARPRDGRDGVAALASATPAQRPVADIAPTRDARIMSYTPDSVRTAVMDKATRYSTTV